MNRESLARTLTRRVTAGSPRATRDHQAVGADLSRLTLRFLDRDFEAAFRRNHFQGSLTNIRTAYLVGVALWMLWGLLLGRYLMEDRGLDLALRYGVFIPMLLVGFAHTFSRTFPRVWEWQVLAVLLATGVTWVTYAAAIQSMPVDYGYVGLILILAFGYTLLRLRFLLVAFSSAVLTAYYLVVALGFEDLGGRRPFLASFYLVTFALLGMLAAYTLERNARLLFLREQQLDHEHRRSETLLLNILPEEIADRLKVEEQDPRGARLAEALPEVTVLFADAAGFTAQAAKSSPNEVVDALDDLFTRFDALADRFGLEKIKTVGDAYMAAAGAPHRRPDHAEAAAEMALAIPEAIEGARWPSGDPIRVRVGMASGPVVAGVIGQRSSPMTSGATR
jgi:adenylate cyclase